MNDDRCDYCAQHENDDSCCFYPLENFLAIGRRSGTLPRSRRRHRTRGCTAFSAVCHVPANIQATSAVECDLWYGVRRPYVALVCRYYTGLEIAIFFLKQRLQISGPSVASGVFEIIWKNASLRFAKFSKFQNLGEEFGSFKTAKNFIFFFEQEQLQKHATLDKNPYCVYGTLNSFGISFGISVCKENRKLSKCPHGETNLDVSRRRCADKTIHKLRPGPLEQTPL